MKRFRRTAGRFGHPRSARRPIAHRGRMLVLGTVLAALVAATDSTAQTSADRAVEYKVKVAYLYNFTRYVRWPDNAFNGAGGPFVIGVLGDDPLGAMLEHLAATRKAQGRRILVRRFGSWPNYRPCHILFISEGTSAAVAQKAIRDVRGKPVLIVGEAPAYAQQGAVLNFYLDAQGRVGFEANVDAAGRHHLQISAKMLQLARIVHDPS